MQCLESDDKLASFFICVFLDDIYNKSLTFGSGNSSKGTNGLPKIIIILAIVIVKKFEPELLMGLKNVINFERGIEVRVEVIGDYLCFAKIHLLIFGSPLEVHLHIGIRFGEEVLV